MKAVRHLGAAAPVLHAAALALCTTVVFATVYSLRCTEHTVVKLRLTNTHTHTHTHARTPDCPGGQAPAGAEDSVVGEHRDIFRAAQQFEDKLRKAKSIISDLFLVFRHFLAVHLFLLAKEESPYLPQGLMATGLIFFFFFFKPCFSPLTAAHSFICSIHSQFFQSVVLSSKFQRIPTTYTRKKD